ncbi:hypothetical protein SO694_00044137 [Aureococcus anophagefferens]|uniref:Uncharacterized protein n=1 Tax=Aureococcus anophagefferens TaxID=44056 RepID=A0ABR1G6X5_AURAN
MGGYRGAFIAYWTSLIQAYLGYTYKNTGGASTGFTPFTDDEDEMGATAQTLLRQRLSSVQMSTYLDGSPRYLKRREMDDAWMYSASQNSCPAYLGGCDRRLRTLESGVPMPTDDELSDIETATVDELNAAIASGALAASYCDAADGDDANDCSEIDIFSTSRWRARARNAFNYAFASTPVGTDGSGNDLYVKFNEVTIMWAYSIEDGANSCVNFKCGDDLEVRRQLLWSNGRQRAFVEAEGRRRLGASNYYVDDEGVNRSYADLIMTEGEWDERCEAKDYHFGMRFDLLYCNIESPDYNAYIDENGQLKAWTEAHEGGSTGSVYVTHDDEVGETESLTGTFGEEVDA